MTTHYPIDRRHFLRGVGGAMLALPHLEIMAAPGATGVPMRMVCVGTSLGFVPHLFFPEQTGEGYETPHLLKPLEKHRQDFTVFSQLDHGAEAVGGHTGVHAFLSGILSKHAKGFKEGNVSVDQKAAAHVGAATRYPSMQFSSGAGSTNQLSWTTSGVAIPPLEDLATIHALLFQETGPQERSVLKQLHNEQRSILDLVRTDADLLRKRVGREDQVKLDQYYISVREVEQRLVQSAQWLERAKPKVAYTVPDDADTLDFADRVPLYYDLMTLALQTDSTRVVTLEISDIGGNGGGLPITRGYHQLTHHGKVESYLEELAIIETYHTTQFARFLDKLAAVNEPNGRTLLDNTMTLLGSGMGNASSHSNRDLPLLLAGGGFKHGQHLRFEKDKSRGTSTPAGNLFLSMLQRFGVESDKFNLATGTLNGLEVV